MKKMKCCEYVPRLKNFTRTFLTKVKVRNGQKKKFSQNVSPWRRHRCSTLRRCQRSTASANAVGTASAHRLRVCLCVCSVDASFFVFFFCSSIPPTSGASKLRLLFQCLSSVVATKIFRIFFSKKKSFKKFLILFLPNLERSVDKQTYFRNKCCSCCASPNSRKLLWLKII